MELVKLPPDVLQLALRFLTGYDAFYLSHTSSRLLHLLSDDGFWCDRLPPAGRFEEGGSSKRRYVKARSLLFEDAAPESAQLEGWAPVVGGDQARRRPFAVLRGVNARGAARSLDGISGAVSFPPGYGMRFSFSLWFALLPATTERPVGGILYGMQSSGAWSTQWPHYHQQIIVVDSQRNLYCSVLDAKKIVASDLDVNRWYHLALNYDVDTKRQEVFVDGANVWTANGDLHHEWRELEYEQVGTGCVTSGNLHFPHPGDVGWYPFNGVIDDFRLHHDALTADEVATLASIGSTGEWSANGALKPADDPQRARGWANAHFVRCSRPAEGKQLCIENRLSLLQ